MSGFGMGERSFNTIICGMVVLYYSAVMPHVFMFFFSAAMLEIPNVA